MTVKVSQPLATNELSKQQTYYLNVSAGNRTVTPRRVLGVLTAIWAQTSEALNPSVRVRVLESGSLGTAFKTKGLPDSDDSKESTWLTAGHMCAQSPSLVLELEGRDLPARVHWSNLRYDICFLKSERTDDEGIEIGEISSRSKVATLVTRSISYQFHHKPIFISDQFGIILDRAYEVTSQGDSGSPLIVGNRAVGVQSRMDGIKGVVIFGHISRFLSAYRGGISHKTPLDLVIPFNDNTRNVYEGFYVGNDDDVYAAREVGNSGVNFTGWALYKDGTVAGDRVDIPGAENHFYLGYRKSKDGTLRASEYHSIAGYRFFDVLETESGTVFAKSQIDPSGSKSDDVIHYKNGTKHSRREIRPDGVVFEDMTHYVNGTKTYRQILNKGTSLSGVVIDDNRNIRADLKSKDDHDCYQYEEFLNGTQKCEVFISPKGVFFSLTQHGERIDVEYVMFNDGRSVWDFVEISGVESRGQ